MIKLVRVGETPNTPIEQYVVDYISELTSKLQHTPFATLALCLEDSNFYMKNGDGVFVKISK